MVNSTTTMPRLSALLAIGLIFSVWTLLGTYLQLPSTINHDVVLNAQIVDEKRESGGNNAFFDIDERNRRVIRKPSAIFESSEQAFSGTLFNGTKTNKFEKILENKPVSKYDMLQEDKLTLVNTLDDSYRFKARIIRNKQRTQSRHKLLERQQYERLKEPTANADKSTSEGLPNATSQISSTWNKEHILSNAIYWSSYLENHTPKGFDDRHVKKWMDFARNSSVVHMQDGCGRMQNRLLTFQNGSLTCCRYRQNMDQLQGEMFSYHLSRILGIKNVPPSVLSLVRSNDWQWKNISDDIPLAEWKQDKIVILTEWIDNLKPAYIPKQYREEDRKMHPTREILENLQLEELVELVQWSDLIVFDYLTANFDRVANNMFNRQWNEFIMDSPTHNLDQIADDGTLVFYDNESGLLHSYRLLEKYSHFHDSLLNSLCIFRSSTADAIKHIHEQQNIGEILWEVFQREEPLYREMPRLPRGNVETLNKRISDVYQQIQKCEQMYR
ncbi:four-jointed box protein 1-like [Glandiceps talaboti]